ncbi:Ig domain-containing protein, partial [Ensifer aridi]|uniref:Ig domain-containing protein n=1 Tax=Ensifer aridi TaxID=1708715 RepID=UPI00111C57D1
SNRLAFSCCGDFTGRRLYAGHAFESGRRGIFDDPRGFHKAATVAAGSNASISPDGRSAHHTFSMAPGSDMPVGLILNPSTGTITGKAIQSGVYTIMIRVSDGNFSEVVQVNVTIA